MLSKAEIARITARVKKEFPNDMALQVVHISRQMFMKEAELMGMGHMEYLSFLDKHDAPWRTKGRGKKS